MKKYLGILKKSPLFEGIAEEDILSLLSCIDCKVKYLDRKQTVFSEGDPADYIGILLSGSAQITSVDYYGNRSITSSVLPSEMFCEAFACAGVKELPVSVITTEPSEIMLIDCRRVMYSCGRACSFHQQVIFNLLNNLAVKNITLHQKLEILSKKTTREKLMAYLLSYAKRSNSNSFDIPFDRQELADFLRVDRSGLSAEISKLCKEGVIKSRKEHFELIRENQG